ncbi:hypothetical protein F7D13_04160 [Methylocystis rosea]|uniref:DUF805 domain-containing protein n=1 Tax=Methylocystis rosea TaxID=173366 RepID=A0ABX6EEN3_9HYPH|nr:hypothetical protein [Methylocystis rosea]QGM93278.1 hypothetical protein F7D13_04160 [Methylocystis rosea]
MLSNLPKITDKSFFIGYLFPVLFFIASLIWFLEKRAFALLSKLGVDPLAESDKLEKAVYFTFFIWTFSIILMLTNKVLFWSIEGYCLPFKNEQLRRREIERFKLKKAQLNELSAEWRRNERDFPIELQLKCTRLARELASDFPSKESSIMPTRFGNVMRSFEDYPRSVYGVDSIPLWLHLLSVMPKEFLNVVEDAKTHVTCLINMFWLSWVMVIFSSVSFIFGLYGSFTHAHNLDIAAGYERSGAFAIGSVLFTSMIYWLMIERARNWGECVKAGFDCFLPALAEKLGFELPRESVKQKQFWIAVSRRSLFNSPLPDHYYVKAGRKVKYTPRSS